MHNYLRQQLVAVLSLVAVSSLYSTETKTELAGAQPPETTRLIADFRTNLPGVGSSGTWQDKLAVTPSGYAIQGGKGADGKGEIHQNLALSQDLSHEKYVELALGVGAKNEVPEVTIAFTDIAGIQYTARIRISQVMPQQPVWFRVKLADFKLNDWQGNKAGKTIDWTRITQWHLQGDWSTMAPFHVVFIALRARQ